mmetsp:Transcript_16277/g.49254  ORF Transcript_16277/g.49254 Transcript_16277/m.49254 type:complete len:365 (-) Transcript_16277:328-1422(-)
MDPFLKGLDQPASLVLDFPLTAQALVVLAALAYWGSSSSSKAKDPSSSTKKPKRVRPLEEQEEDDSWSLPEDLITAVLTYVDTQTVATGVASACERWRTLAEDDGFWRMAFERDFAEQVVSPADLATTEQRRIVPRRRAHGGASFEREEVVSWKERYSRFALTWLGRHLVGANVEGARVYVGIRGSLYDVTPFVARHPGTTDALLDNSGADATAFFEDVGHSTDARQLLASFLRVPNPRTGALASIKRKLETSRRSALHAAPTRCLHCSAYDGLVRPRLFFDHDHWRCWWPCCGDQIDLDVRLGDGRRDDFAFSSFVPRLGASTKGTACGAALDAAVSKPLSVIFPAYFRSDDATRVDQRVDSS